MSIPWIKSFVSAAATHVGYPNPWRRAVGRQWLDGADLKRCLCANPLCVVLLPFSDSPVIALLCRHCPLVFNLPPSSGVCLSAAPPPPSPPPDLMPVAKLNVPFQEYIGMSFCNLRLRHCTVET